MSSRFVRLPGRRTVVAALSLLMAGCQPAQTWKLVDARDTLPPLALRMQDVKTGKVVTAQDYRGQVVVLFFGYTFCPDVCPTTLGTLTAVMDQLKGQSRKVTVLYVTVDPERDTPQALKDYVGSFSPRTVGLRGTPNELAVLARRYRVAYTRVEGSTPQYYTMNHTATVFIFDKDGRIQRLAPYGASVSDIAHDLRRLIDAPEGR